MSLLQHCFTADAKFLTSFLTIAVHCEMVPTLHFYIFFLLNFGTTLSPLSSFNRELKQRHSTHVNRKSRPLSFLICHETQTYITNSLNGTLCPKIWASYCSAEYCPRIQKTHFRLRCIWLKTSLLKLTD